MKSFSEINKMNGTKGFRAKEEVEVGPSNDATSDIKAPDSDSATMDNNPMGDREQRMNNPGRYA